MWDTDAIVVNTAEKLVSIFINIKMPHATGTVHIVMTSSVQRKP
jgi:hypothetical protein